MRASDFEPLLMKLSDRVYELESTVKEMETREVKLIKRVFDAEKMIEQLGDAFTRRKNRGDEECDISHMR